MSAPESRNARDPDLFGPVVAGPLDEARIRELRANMGVTVFGFRESPVLRGGWDRYDLLAVIGIMRRTRTLWGLDPAMGDMELAEALRRQADLAGDSPLSRAERFSRITFDYHELCVRIFGEYPHALDPREGPPEWRYALAAYVFFLRLKDASVRLDRMAEAMATPERTFAALFGEYANTIARRTAVVSPAGDNVFEFPAAARAGPNDVKQKVYDAANAVMAAAE